MKRINILISLLVFALFMAVGIGCTDITYNIDNSGTQPVVTADQFEVTREALDTYLAANTAPTISAKDLYDLLNDGDTSNDPTVVSVRAESQYEKGHVPGAINIPYKEIADPANLAKIPLTKDVVCYCYTGHTGAVATTVLNALGYNAKNMKYGMCDWTKDSDVRGTSCFSDAEAHDYPTETTAHTLPSTQALPTLNNTTSQDDYEIVRAAAEAYLSGELPATIKAADLYDLLNDGDTSNDPLIISVRAEDVYAKGHVPGAINIPWRNIAQVASLKMIPKDKDIVVYCYTGHTGGVATTVLCMLGYKAKNMKFGMCAWTRDADIRGTTPFSEDTGNDYPFNTGPNP
jgi:rhodanese-related sulfurtransferase